MATLAQWIISMAISVVITLGSMQSFLLIAKLHRAQGVLSEEQSQIRFFVGFVRAILHSALLPSQACGNETHQELALQPVSTSKDPKLSFRICSYDGLIPKMIPVHFYSVPSENKKKIAVYLQQNNNRRECLIDDLQLFSVAYCSKVNTQSCLIAAEIKDWASIEAIEFTLQFKSQPLLEHLLLMENNHQWKFRIKLGSDNETR